MGENGIITLAKRAKENIELAQIEEERELNELYTQLENQEELTQGTGSYTAVLRLNEFKKKIADYIDEAAKGSIDLTNEYKKLDYTTASIETFGLSIKQIVKEVTKDATATAEDIAKDKTAWINGSKITGTANINSVTKGTALIPHLTSNTSYGKITSSDLSNKNTGLYVTNDNAYKVFSDSYITNTNGYNDVKWTYNASSATWVMIEFPEVVDVDYVSFVIRATTSSNANYYCYVEYSIDGIDFTTLQSSKTASSDSHKIFYVTTEINSKLKFLKIRSGGTYSNAGLIQAYSN